MEISFHREIVLGRGEVGHCSKKTRLNEDAESLPNEFKYVSSGELQGNSSSLDPCYFTRIFAKELPIHANVAIITSLKASQRDVGMHKNTTKRDILDCGWVILIPQFQ